MHSERWKRIDHLFHAAVKVDPAARAAFLSQACADDDSLRQEIEALLDSHEQSRDFIEEPPGDLAAAVLAQTEIRLKIGDIIGAYKILSLLGRGGMGEVYLALDTRLERLVAFKRLSADCMFDDERVRRFELEARAASALNHPNIITIHEIGKINQSHYIVTEFIEGETLRTEMGKRQMPLNETLSVAIQVASALDAAHEAGIMHRDIKPENIMLRRDKIAKVLDFGLAKLSSRQGLPADGDDGDGTINTEPGIVIGTVSYMSPEQAGGGKIDTRTDVWSLGIVIYEMITGRTPFTGETRTDLIVSIIKDTPDPLPRFAPDIPDELQRIVDKALRKDREERYKTAKEMLSDLKSLKRRLKFEADLKRSLAANTGQPA